MNPIQNKQTNKQFDTRDFIEIINSDVKNFSYDELKLLKNRIPQYLEIFREYADKLNRQYKALPISNYDNNKIDFIDSLKKYNEVFSLHTDKENYRVIFRNKLDKSSEISLKIPRSYEKQINQEIDELLKKHPLDLDSFEQWREIFVPIISVLGTDEYKMYDMIANGIKNDIKEKSETAQNIKNELNIHGLFNPNYGYDSGGLENSKNWQEIVKKTDKFISDINKELNPAKDIDKKKSILKSASGKLKGLTSGVVLADERAQQIIDKKNLDKISSKQKRNEQLISDLLNPATAADAKKKVLNLPDNIRASIFKKAAERKN